jgi:hypothetical protein
MRRSRTRRRSSGRTLLIAERTFRRLDAPELLADAEGVIYLNGERVKPSQTTAERKAAA